MSAAVVLGLLAAGGAGSAARFTVDGAVRARTAGEFPWATLLINVTGSLLLGVLTGLTLFRGSPGDVRLVLGTGFCGGYTTFSTASVETVRLAQRGRWGAATANLLGSTVLTVAAGALGLWVVH